MVTTDPLKSALCLQCNYSLHGLAESRCPECGARFDPENCDTMNLGKPMGRLVRRLRQPYGVGPYILHFTALALMLWGMAALPGGFYVFGFGVLILCLAYAYRLVRWTLQHLVVRAYRQPRTLIKPRMPHWTWIAVAITAALLIANIPIRATITLNRLLVQRRVDRMYYEEPATLPSRPAQWMGVFYVERVDVNPSGVTLVLPWYSLLVYAPDSYVGNYYWGYAGGGWYFETVIR